MSALNVWTSSARTGCLQRESTQVSHIHQRTFHPIHCPKHIHFHARPKGRRRLVVPRVHNAAPHMLPYIHQRVSVDIELRHNTIAAMANRNTAGHIRLGAVSSITSRTISLIPETSPEPLNPAHPGKPSQLTNASSLSNIDGQIGLGPARLRLIHLYLARGTEGHRALPTHGGSGAMRDTECGLRGTRMEQVCGSRGRSRVRTAQIGAKFEACADRRVLKRE
jgi:hypothetical protein